FVEHEVGKGVAVERANEVVERLVQHLGQAAAPGDDALIAGGKTFDKREIRLGRAYDGAEINSLGRLCQREAAGSPAHALEVAQAREDIDHLHQMGTRDIVG